MSKSKKKLKARLAAGSGSQRLLGITEQMQNVKNHFAPQATPEANPLPVSNVVELLDSEVDFQPAAVDPEKVLSTEKWNSDEDENDGGTIAAVPQIPSAPVEEILPVSNDVPQQTEVNQESSTMNVVNHPTQQEAQTVTSNAITNAASTVSESIVSEGAMEQMQHDANTVPPAAQTTQPEAIVAEFTPAKKQNAAFHHLATTVLITLDMSNFGHMSGLKNALSRVKMDGQEFNCYSPFRKAGKKTETNPSAEGILRYALSNILDMTDAINNSRLMILGDEDQVEEKIRSSMETTRNQIVNLFPSNMDHVVASLLDEENERTVQLQVKDIVNVRSWVNYSADSASDDTGALIGIHNAAFHITVNAGMLYDTEDRMKYVSQVEKLVQMLVEKREDANTTILFGLMLESATLTDAAMRQMFDALLSGEEYILYSAKEMHKLEASDFLPQTNEEIDTQVLTENGDMLLIRMLTDGDEEEVETEGAEEPATE